MAKKATCCDGTNCETCLRFIPEYAWFLPNVHSYLPDYCMHAGGTVNPAKHANCPHHSDKVPLTPQETGDLRDLQDYLRKRKEKEAQRVQRSPAENKRIARKNALSWMAMQMIGAGALEQADKEMQKS